MRIGELLVSEGLITPGQLDEALKMQVVFGGRLGTNLIELGYLEEEDIARVLSRKLRMPFASPSELSDIPPHVIAALPREIAEKHKAVPIRLENRRLTLAMYDATDLRAIDEIAFRTGFVVQAAVTPELRLLQALETYYQIPRDIRYIPVKRTPAPSRRPSPPRTEAPPSSASAKPVPSPGPVPAPSRTPAAISPARQEAVPAPPAPPAPSAPPAPRAVPAIAAALAPAAPEVPAPVQEEAPSELPVQDLEAIARHLAEAGDREDIADLAISWTGARFGRSALFLVRPDGAQGWRAARDRRPVEGFGRLHIPFTEPSVLKTVMESRSCFVGPLPRAPFNSLVLQELGGGVPQTALLLPLLMMGRVIAILYVDGPSDLQSELLSLQKLAAKMIMAFEILVLKNKIIMV